MAKSKDLVKEPETAKERRARFATMKAEIKKLYGWTDKEYTKAYDVYKHKVRAYNKLSGAQLSATEEFYYSRKALKKGGQLFGRLETIERLSSATGKTFSTTTTEKAI